jgi:hypothetical protein
MRAQAAALQAEAKARVAALQSIYPTRALTNQMSHLDTNLHYFNAEELAAARVKPGPGGEVLTEASSEPWRTNDALLTGSVPAKDVRGYAIYGLNETGEMVISNKGEFRRIHHSSFGPAYQNGFGRVQNYPNGAIAEIDNFSGHFKPNEQDFLAQLLSMKEQGYSFKQARVVFYYPNPTTSAFMLFKKHESLFRHLGVDDYTRLSVRGFPGEATVQAPARSSGSRSGSSFDWGF